ncbi:MAG TPA: carboxypeptidase-like regulatory domain-containing protein, partial [Chitinophagaceae bacterium]|nr:carboxypeptidase-like regulatory domain-containing protein [Chitinophagaceae bacterium]
MKLTLLFSFFILSSLFSKAGKISGVITDEKGNALPYASVSIKGTTRGANSNSSGRFSITLNPGQYTLIAQYVGY